MPLVHLVIVLALGEFLYFSYAVATARGRLGVPAPATTGNEEFERYFRVHMNTLEQLVMFIPSLLIFGHYVSAYIGAALGVIFIIGRWIYFRAYIRNPKKRSLGFALSAMPTYFLMIGAAVGAAKAAYYM
jgi:glutathione S-transferase